MNKKEVGFHYGALADDLEKQANAQGYTLGDKAETMQKLADGLIINHVWDTLTDSAYDRALSKLQDLVVKNLKPLKKNLNTNRKG